MYLFFLFFFVIRGGGSFAHLVNGPNRFVSEFFNKRRPVYGVCENPLKTFGNRTYV